MFQSTFLPGGSAYITAEIEKAVAGGSRTAAISGCWEIDSAVRIPDHFTLILENCHLRQADGCFDNIFVNSNHGTDLGRTQEGTNRNISIIGRGNAVLDGGNYNGLSERSHSKNGMPPIWKNNMILFTNVDGFKISGLTCRNQRWWALNFIYCRNGYIGNIDFCSSDLRIDENGQTVHGLVQRLYEQTLVKNSDGIDLRQGCHDIVIENITGFTEDDCVALTGLNWIMESAFAVEGLPSDICRVDIRNIRAAAYCSIVRLLNQGGIKLHDITVDGVYDTAAECPHLDIGGWGIRIGDTHLYGERHSAAAETYNIKVQNVYSCAAHHAVRLAGTIENLVMYGIECAENTKMLCDLRNN